jgi:hypothetical protein
MVRVEVAVDDLRMMSVLDIPRMDVLGRQEQQSKHTECGENSDELPANASWHHRPLSVRVNRPSIGQVKLARNLEREQVVVKTLPGVTELLDEAAEQEERPSVVRRFTKQSWLL